MASDAEEADQDESLENGGPSSVSNGKPTRASGEEAEAEAEASEEEEEEDDEEPRLKYASLTKHLRPVYRNGDATSAFLVAGDKMVRPALKLATPTLTRREDCGNAQWEHSRLRHTRIVRIILTEFEACYVGPLIEAHSSIPRPQGLHLGPLYFAISPSPSSYEARRAA